VLEVQPISWHERREKAEKLIDQARSGAIYDKIRDMPCRAEKRRRLKSPARSAINPTFILLDRAVFGNRSHRGLGFAEDYFRSAGQRIGVLITDHNVRETLSVTDRAYIINEGRIFRSGTPEELGSDPEVRRVYLGESFSLV